MKLQNTLILDWKDFVAELEKRLGRTYNGAGIWNCPDEPAFDIDKSSLSESCGYMSGESKFICRFCLDPLCEPGTWKDAIIPNDPGAFLAKFSKSGYEPTHPNSRQLIVISADAGLEWLVHEGVLNRGDEIWLYYSY